jgi:hypothetical protein
MGVEMTIIVGTIIFTLLTVFGFASDRSIAVRDLYGNFVETKDRHGDDTTCGIVTEILSEQQKLIDNGDSQ